MGRKPTNSHAAIGDNSVDVIIGELIGYLYKRGYKMLAWVVGIVFVSTVIGISWWLHSTNFYR